MADKQSDPFDVLFGYLMGVPVNHRTCLDCNTGEEDREKAIKAFDGILKMAWVPPEKLVVFGGITWKEARERLLDKKGERCLCLAGLRDDLKKHLSRR